MRKWKVLNNMISQQTGDMSHDGEEFCLINWETTACLSRLTKKQISPINACSNICKIFRWWISRKTLLLQRTTTNKQRAGHI